MLTDREPEWVHDEAADRYYRSGVVTQSAEPVETHFPQLEERFSEVTVAEGRFSDPGERVTIPGPDDYWWQAVLTLEPDDAAALVERAAAGGAADGFEDSPVAVSEEDVLRRLVPPLEEVLTPCEGDWIGVAPALERAAGGGVTAGGGLLEMAAVCESSGQLITSARAM